MVLKATLATMLFYALHTAVFFVAAGRWDLPLAWAYFVMNAAVGLMLVLVLGMKDPGLLKERLKPAPGEQDRVYRPAAMVSSIATLVVAGIDVGRRHWWPVVPVWLQIVSVVVVL